MDIRLDLDTKKVKKALKLTEKQLGNLHKRAAKRTSQNVRVIASKGNLGVEGLRRKKVPRARVRHLKGATPGIWFGLNDVRASEFKEKPRKVPGGVVFRGKFYEGYFLARFRHDQLPKSIKRAVKLPEGNRSWVEIMVPIEKEARAFIEREIEPKIGELFNKNFGQAVDGLAHVRRG